MFDRVAPNGSGIAEGGEIEAQSSNFARQSA